MERGFAVPVPGIHSRAALQEEFGNGLKSVGGRLIQRRPSVRVRGINVGLMGQQQLDCGLIPVLDRLQEKGCAGCPHDRTPGITEAVARLRRCLRCPHVRIGAALKQHYEGRSVREGIEQHWGLVRRGDVWVRFETEQFLGGVGLSLADRKGQRAMAVLPC